ncbi:MAG: hypothetical protein RL077_6076 [Verrucomicrobiota bacterium]|jgi:hypothetical protein
MGLGLRFRGWLRAEAAACGHGVRWGRFRGFGKKFSRVGAGCTTLIFSHDANTPSFFEDAHG